ncbi:protein of unknown function (plasmid) [Pararobbsia alpina]
MVHDAEIAATLMNRWDPNGDAGEGALQLLKEGRLNFTMEHGVFERPDATLDHALEFECLVFEDGSRILRLVNTHTAQGLTPWFNVAPPTDFLGLGGAADTRGRYGRPHTDEPHLLSD